MAQHTAAAVTKWRPRPATAREKVHPMHDAAASKFGLSLFPPSGFWRRRELRHQQMSSCEKEVRSFLSNPSCIFRSILPIYFEMSSGSGKLGRPAGKPMQRSRFRTSCAAAAVLELGRRLNLMVSLSAARTARPPLRPSLMIYVAENVRSDSALECAKIRVSGKNRIGAVTPNKRDGRTDVSPESGRGGKGRVKLPISTTKKVMRGPLKEWQG